MKGWSVGLTLTLVGNKGTINPPGIPVAVAELRWRWRQERRAASGRCSRRRARHRRRRLPQFVPQRGQVLQRPADGLDLERLLAQLESGGPAGAAVWPAAAGAAAAVAAVVVTVDAAVGRRSGGRLEGTRGWI